MGESVEGIHIYNISSQKGTITDENGIFKMNMAENDRLEITAMQFVPFKVIIDKGVLEHKQVKIYMNPAINELEEVIIRPYDLTGSISVDVANIDTFDAGNELDISYEEVQFGYEFAPDGLTEIKGNVAADAFHNGQSQNALDFKKGIGTLVNSIFGPRKKKNTFEEETISNKQLYHSLRGRFTNDVLLREYGIPEDKTNQFIYFLEESGIPTSYLKKENELQLFDYVMNQSTAFIKQIEK